MAGRYLGIELQGCTARVAILAGEKGGPRLLAVGKRSCAGAGELPAVLRELAAGEGACGGRVAAAVPAAEGFVRWLRFPFADAKKIDAVLPFELAAGLPIPVEEFSADFQQPVPRGKGCRVAAAAVRKGVIRNHLAAFEAAGIELQVLDLAPFAFVSGLRRHFSDGVLVCLADHEVAIALVCEGRVEDYRIEPFGLAGTDEERVRFICRQSTALMKAAGREGLGLYLIGSGATQAVLDRLRGQHFAVEVPACSLDGKPLDPEFLPAVLLAWRAAQASREKGFNFRRGEFALQSRWAGLRKRLVAAVVLLALTAVAAAGSAWLDFAHRARRAEALQGAMEKIYRESFPGQGPIVDVVLQMKSNLQGMQEQARLLGLGGPGTALTLLREISRAIDPAIRVDMRELTYHPDLVRLDGDTDSFDAVNRLTRGLERSPLVKEVRIATAKMSLDGSRVDFRLDLVLAAEESP